METEQILQMWNEDSVISVSYGEESINIPKLHSKYINILIRQKHVLIGIDQKIKSLYLDLYDYYTGDISEETEKERGWEPFPKRILKSDVQRYIDANADWQKLLIKKSMCQEKISLLEEILKNINGRGWVIKNAIEWEKYQAGII